MHFFFLVAQKHASLFWPFYMSLSFYIQFGASLSQTVFFSPRRHRSSLLFAEWEGCRNAHPLHSNHLKRRHTDTSDSRKRC